MTGSLVGWSASALVEYVVRCADKPQDYITSGGHMTTNTIEGFHGLLYTVTIGQIWGTHPTSARATWTYVTSYT